ncbi:Uncharacterised protein [Mycobacterium tuberculosis]|nr:Uncharacterised protein [Mycobacterium tuberculosis]
MKNPSADCGSCDATRRYGVVRFTVAGVLCHCSPNDRAISISCTSVVPSPISSTLLSR